MASNYRDDEGPITEINVTPLVDVVLVLLVIFMVTAPIIAAQGIAVDSPKVATGEPVESPMNLIITAEGELVVSGPEGQTRFPADSRLNARPLLEAFHQNNPDTRAVVAGDVETPHGAVMEVVDMLRDIGMTRFALRTAPAKTP